MHITERFLSFTLMGAEWVLWLLIILSIVSVAIMIERGVFFLTHRYDFEGRGQDVARALRKHDLAAARAKVKDSDLSEDRVVSAGLAEAGAA